MPISQQKLLLYSTNSDSTNLYNDELEGGKNQECNIIDEIISQRSKELISPIFGEENVQISYDLKNIKRTDFPITLNPKTATFHDVAIHALLRQRLSQNTVKKRMSTAKFMETHTRPVDFRNPNYENFINHMDYRENEWKTMRMFLKAYGMKTWTYKPPSTPRYKARVIPFPDQVYKILNLEYSKKSYENALIQYLLTHNFIIGWRFPSEPAEMKVSDVHIERGYITITEPKKHSSTRNLSPTEIMNNRRRKSFRNWVYYWRPKVENQYSKDYLYLRPDGKPFTRDQLRQLLNRKAKPVIETVFPEYYNYCSRHFAAVSRLIRTKLQYRAFDEYEVKDWLGHTKIETTMGYIKDAKHYYLLAKYDWVNRVLKAPSNGWG